MLARLCGAKEDTTEKAAGAKAATATPPKKAAGAKAAKAAMATPPPQASDDETATVRIKMIRLSGDSNKRRSLYKT